MNKRSKLNFDSEAIFITVNIPNRNKEGNLSRDKSKESSFRDYEDKLSNAKIKLNDKIQILQGKIEHESMEKRSNNKLFERKQEKYELKVKDKIRRQKSNRRTLILSNPFNSPQKKRRIQSAWKSKTDAKTSVNWSVINSNIPNISQSNSLMKFEDINDQNIYKNLKQRKLRPKTAVRSSKNSVSRKAKTNTHSKGIIMPFCNSFKKLQSRETSPEKNLSKEKIYHRSNRKKTNSKLFMMKELWGVKNKSFDLNAYSNSSSKRIRPQSGNVINRHKYNISFDTSVQKNVIEKVELNLKVKQPVLSEDELVYLFQAKWKDLKFSVNLDQFERFRRYLGKESNNGKLKMVNLGLSKHTAVALWEIFKKNHKIKRLYISRNKLQNEGAIVLATLLKMDTNLIHIDLASNGISYVGFHHIFQSLLNNHTIVSLNLSSIDMSTRNRLGTKGAKMLKRLLKCSPYIQFLNVSSTALCNEGTKILMEGLWNTKTLLSLSIKGNEITSEIIAELTATIISSSLESIDLSDNNIGNSGITEFTAAIRSETWKIKILKIK